MDGFPPYPKPIEWGPQQSCRKPPYDALQGDSYTIFGMWRTVLALLVIAAAAKPQEPSLAAIGEWTDALSWTSSLREPMRRMTNPVVTTYGIASLAAIACQFDEPLGSGMFREALADLNDLPDGIFHDFGKLLPVATFSGLWKLVLGPGIKCDKSMPQPNDRARAKRESEKSEAGSFLKQAKEDLKQPKDAVDYDRAAQLARAALEAGDPSEFDISALADFLAHLRGPAPDLADDLFLRAIAFVMEAPVPSLEDLANLGGYLFGPPPSTSNSEPQRPYSVNGATFSNWQLESDNANPDLVPLYIGAMTGLLLNSAAVDADPVAAYAAAYQLLPKAQELGLADAATLQRLLGQAQAQNPDVAAAVQAKLAPGSSLFPTPAEFAHLTAQIRAAISASRFAEARNILTEVDGVTVRSLIGSVIDFSEYAYPLRGKDSDRTMALAGKLPAGMKRALLYAGVVATSSNRLTAIFALHLGLKDAELLSYEQRMAVLPALATAASGVDRDETQAVLSSIIASANGANTSPRKSRFDPKYPFSFDGPRVLRGPDGFQELIEGAQGRATFPLEVAEVTAFSLEDFIAQAKNVDFMRLEATVEGLRNELQLTRAYLALARLRLKIAKARTTKGG